MEKRKIWGEDRYVWEFKANKVYLSEDRERVYFVDIPENFDNVEDDQILDLEIDGDSSEELRIVFICSRQEIREILNEVL